MRLQSRPASSLWSQRPSPRRPLLLCVILFANYAHSLASFRRIPGTMATRRRRIPHTKNKSFAHRKRSPDVQHAKIRLVR